MSILSSLIGKEAAEAQIYLEQNMAREEIKTLRSQTRSLQKVVEELRESK